MAKQDLLIKPQLTLPTRPTPPPPARGRSVSWRARAFLIGAELAYLFIAANLGIIAYYLLASQPVYKIVAFVCLLIVWANFATATARSTTAKKQAIEIVGAVKRSTSKHQAIKSVLSEDTTKFLRAVRHDTLRSLH